MLVVSSYAGQKQEDPEVTLECSRAFTHFVHSALSVIFSVESPVMSVTRLPSSWTSSNCLKVTDTCCVVRDTYKPKAARIHVHHSLPSRR